jgi:hypothetical protein
MNYHFAAMGSFTRRKGANSAGCDAMQSIVDTNTHTVDWFRRAGRKDTRLTAASEVWMLYNSRSVQARDGGSVQLARKLRLSDDITLAWGNKLVVNLLRKRD